MFYEANKSPPFRLQATSSRVTLIYGLDMNDESYELPANQMITT
jgi:hypothetical protein